MNYRGARLRFERLEDRHLLTAVVDQAGGEVEITGDADAESVVIIQLSQTSFEISGDVQGGTQTVNGVTRMEVRLDENTDRLRVVGARIDGSLPAGLYIDMGENLDSATIKRLNISGDAVIDREEFSSSEIVRLQRVDFAGATALLTADGRDRITVRNSTLADAVIESGAGNDREDVVVVRNTQMDDVTIQLLEGDDELSIHGSSFDFLDVNGHDGDDTVTVESSTANAASLHTNDGADMLRVMGSIFGDAELHLHEGDDLLEISANSQFQGNLSLATFDGDDDVVIADSSFQGAVNAFLFEDADLLDVRNSVFNGDVFYDGGEGGVDDDELIDNGNVYNANRDDENFEQRTIAT